MMLVQWLIQYRLGYLIVEKLVKLYYIFKETITKLVIRCERVGCEIKEIDERNSQCSICNKKYIKY